jgi:bifunctional non-homologous end joining protein LigD
MKPMLATLVEEPFNDPHWIFEIKWDGYRAVAHKTKKVQLLSRNDKSFNARFPFIVKELEKLPGKFILDGEIVILDKQGRSRFQLLQNYENTKAGTPHYYIFDIISYQGKDLTHLPLIKRKELLRKLLGKKARKYLRFSDHIEKQGKRLFTLAKKKKLEGIIAKKRESPYRFKRSKDWLKIKTKMRQEVVIGGFTEPRGSRKYFGALLVGVYKKGKLVYAGHVGGGFDRQLLKTIYGQMIKLARKKSPFLEEPHPNAPIVWIQPKLVCEIAFAEWTHDGIMRQPIFQGMRVDKSPKEVLREVKKV